MTTTKIQLQAKHLLAQRGPARILRALAVELVNLYFQEERGLRRPVPDHTHATDALDAVEANEAVQRVSNALDEDQMGLLVG